MQTWASSDIKSTVQRQSAAKKDITLDGLAWDAKCINRRSDDSTYDGIQAINHKKQRRRHNENNKVETAHLISTIEQFKKKIAPALEIVNQTSSAENDHSIRSPRPPGHEKRYKPPPSYNSRNGYNRQGRNTNYRQHQHQTTGQHAHTLQNQQKELV